MYQQRVWFSLVRFWAYPRAAIGALLEVMPWEALALSSVVTTAAWIRLGHDLGTATGLSVTLALVTLQMLRTRTFVTPSRVVWQRGLLGTRRSEVLLLSLLDGRVEHSEGAGAVGDVVLVTAAGEVRLRALVFRPRNAGKHAAVITDNATG